MAEVPKRRSIIIPIGIFLFCIVVGAETGNEYTGYAANLRIRFWWVFYYSSVVATVAAFAVWLAGCRKFRLGSILCAMVIWFGTMMGIEHYAKTHTHAILIQHMLTDEQEDQLEQFPFPVMSLFRKGNYAVFVENIPERIEQVTRALEEMGVNLGDRPATMRIRVGG
jgi:hypothetical protein